MSAAKSYVRTDERGVFRVGQGRVSLDSVVYAYLQGQSAETINEQYPSVSLEEVYGAIAYYLANQQDVDAYLHKQEQVWEKFKDQAERNVPPVVQRLRALRGNGQIRG